MEGLDPRCRQTLLTLGASGAQVAWGSLKEARYEIGMVCVTAFGRVITEVGIAMMLGGNIRYETRTMTTAIALETSKGEFAQGIALGLVRCSWLLWSIWLWRFCAGADGAITAGGEAGHERVVPMPGPDAALRGAHSAAPARS